MVTTMVPLHLAFSVKPIHDDLNLLLSPPPHPPVHIGLARQHRIFLTNHSKTAVLYIEIAALSP